jgi:cyclopropane fatty-acyl-phospholipid synthase-like methyltransferase
MGKSNRTDLFDHWAKKYDNAVTDGNFPFTGYETILDEVFNLADVKPGMQILDLGIGTGNLASRFLREGCCIWGIDFSKKMLAASQAKLPQANLVQANLLDQWPIQSTMKFDRIVSGYVFHEFDLPTKVNLLHQAFSYLVPDSGVILIADIAFPTTKARSEAYEHWKIDWDEAEFYWAADESISICRQTGIEANYKQISNCGGIFTFTAD